MRCLFLALVPGGEGRRGLTFHGAGRAFEYARIAESFDKTRPAPRPWRRRGGAGAYGFRRYLPCQAVKRFAVRSPSRLCGSPLATARAPALTQTEDRMTRWGCERLVG